MIENVDRSGAIIVLYTCASGQAVCVYVVLGVRRIISFNTSRSTRKEKEHLLDQDGDSEKKRKKERKKHTVGFFLLSKNTAPSDSSMQPGWQFYKKEGIQSCPN